MKRCLIGAALALAVTLSLPARAFAAPATQNVTIYIFGDFSKIAVGPDGKTHDTVVPSGFVVKADVPVTVTVINNDSITAPGLKLDALIKSGREEGDKVIPVTTTFTFTPHKRGSYRWHCRIPCDSTYGYWAMGMGYGGPGKEGFMSGQIVVI